MYGTFIGDRAGSIPELIEGTASRNGFKVPYEDRIKILDKSQKLYSDGSTHTDDTVLSLAVMKKLLGSGTYEENYRYFGNIAISQGDTRGIPAFGSNTEGWLERNIIGETMKSYGNGGSMRVAAIGYFYNDLETTLKEVAESCKPTHNNEEAIKCAEMVATGIFMSRKGFSKGDIKRYLQKNYNYKLDYSLEYLQKNYIFTTRSKNSVPIAISIFLQSNGFEDAVRKAISVGGDADTIASIAGALAESHYGIPTDMIEEIQEFLPDYAKEVTDEFYNKIKTKIRKKLFRG